MLNPSFSQTIQVKENQTASHYGSGLLPVFATPALISLMENTAMQLIELSEGSSSVGISINMKHLKASAISETICCTATITEVDGRRYCFELKATDSSGDLNIEKFMSKCK